MTQIIENRTNTKAKFAVFTGVLLILAIGVGSVWFGLWGEIGKNYGQSETNLPSGTLITTYAAIDQSNDSARFLPVSLNLPKGDRSYVENSDIFLRGIHHDISQNEKWLSFVDNATSTDETSEQNIWPNAVYRINIENNALEVMAQAAENAEVLSHASIPAFPVVANNGSVLYMSSTNPSLSDSYLYAEAEDWEIVLVEEGSEPVVVTKGSHPQWLDDENFLFLKRDGIYQYSLENASETRLAPSVPGAAHSSRLAVDVATKQVLFIEPPIGAVRLFTLEQREEGLVLTEEEPIVTDATSAIFSRDGEYVALTTIKNASEQPNELQLTIYNIDNRSIAYEAILPNASLTFTSLQAWIP